VIGKGDSVTFICESSDSKKKLMGLIDELIGELKEREKTKFKQLNKMYLLIIPI
jgi:hypothetical protein